MSAASMHDPLGPPDDAPPSRPDLRLVTSGKPARVLSTRWIMVGVAIAISAASVVVSGLVTERQAQRALADQLQSRLFLTARNLSLAGAQALLSDYPELTLHPLVLRLHAAQPELGLIAVTDRDGVLLGHRDPELLHQRFQPPTDGVPQPAPAGVEPGETLLNSPSLQLARVPVRHPDGRVIGAVWVGSDRAHLYRLLAEARRQQAVACAVLALLGAIVSFFVVSYLLRHLSTLRAGIQRIGRGDLDHRIAIRDRTELGLLANAIDDMAGRLKVAQEETVDRARLAHEVELARRIQHSMLPAHPMREGDFVVRGDHRAAAEVGGDYYDMLRLSDGSIAVAIADVSGKGLAGCLVMSMLSVLIRALRESHRSPSALLITLDSRLSESLQPGQFVTMFYGVLDPRTGRMVFASAGHNDLLVYRAATGGIEHREERGMPLAAVRGGAIRATLEDQTLQLTPGDIAIQFTDGYSEAFDPGHTRQYGLPRLCERAAALGTAGSLAVLKGLRQDVEEWRNGSPPSDDETLLVVGCEPEAAESADRILDPDSPEGESEWAIHCFEKARQRGRMLRIPAQLDVMSAIRSWVREEVTLGQLELEQAGHLDMALYEVCANIAEHGYETGPRGTLELWWLPPETNPETGTAEAVADERVRRSLFIVRDHGRPFQPREHVPANLDHSDVRRRGRGFGLDIIHLVMSEVRYVPGTSRGNLTLLRMGGPGEARPVSREVA